MACIGIIGARKYKDRQSILGLVNAIPVGSIIITSSCQGVCTWVAEAAKALGLEVKIYSPNLTGIRTRTEMVERYYHRNRQLIEACDIVHAFISREDGFVGGTKFEVQYAKRLNKEVFLHWENGGVQRICQIPLPLGIRARDLSDGWRNFFSEVLVM